MLSFVFRKMLSNKWMIASLLIGNILLCAMSAAVPMYTDATFQRVLSEELDALETDTVDPGNITVDVPADKKTKTQKLDNAKADADAFVNELGFPAEASAVIKFTEEYKIDSVTVRDQLKYYRLLSLLSVSDFAEHVNIVSGRMFEDEIRDGNVVEVVINRATMRAQDYLVGEQIKSNYFKNGEEDAYILEIVGVYDPIDPEDSYWSCVQPGNTFGAISDTVFEQMFHSENSYNRKFTVRYAYCMDRDAMDAAEADRYHSLCIAFRDRCSENYSGTVIPVFFDTLSGFLKEQASLNITLWVLLVPIFVLLAFFIFMVSRQILDQEKNTIAVIKSRGASRGQIILIFLIQSTILAAVSVILGLLLGALICRVLGYSNGFLSFIIRKPLSLRLTTQVILFTLAAALVSILTMIIPVLSISKTGIVDYKRSTNDISDRFLWLKFAAAAVLIGVAVYGYYSFNNQIKFLIAANGTASIDPLLFLCSSLFIFGAGLLISLLLPLLIRLVYYIGRRFWSPALYASFIKVIRSVGDQRFIMIFLVFTIAIGLFNATTARTINQNSEDDISYVNGADMVVKEVWEDNRGSENDVVDFVLYTEPDYAGYEALTETYDIKATKVLNNPYYKVSLLSGVRVMGINTTEFAEIAWMGDNILPTHFYNYLNALSQEAGAVLLSSNFQTLQGYSLGDRIRISDENDSEFTGIVYGFFDYWPSYRSTSSKENSKGVTVVTDEYMIVCNLAQAQAVWGVSPYEIWFDVDDTAPIYDFMNSSGKQYVKVLDSVNDLIENKKDPVLQGTNGILTVGFVLVLLVCMTGFLIFWILSIRSRTLQFGIFRAMGMSMGSIWQILLNEQVLISLLSVIAGGAVGWCASQLYVPLIQLSYTSADAVLPLQIVTEKSDYFRLFGVVGLLFAVSLVILYILVKRIRIAQALKLGED